MYGNEILRQANGAKMDTRKREYTPSEDSDDRTTEKRSKFSKNVTLEEM